MMVAEVFVLCFPVTTELNGRIQTIDMLRDRYIERILMKMFLKVCFFLIEDFMQFPYCLMFIW